MTRTFQPIRTASLAAFLMAFWLLLSGHYTAWLIGAGLVLSVAIAVGVTAAGAADEEGYPLAWLGRAVRYWPWLLLEIGKSAVGVARVVIDPRLPIAPRFLAVPATQKTGAGIAVYANSITLTPGTIAVELHRRPGEMLVHALTAETAEGVQSGEMDRRVTAAEAA
jgi:multicomponent Na+:H+ antiporter subunit E